MGWWLGRADWVRLGSGEDLETLLFKFLTMDKLEGGGGRGGAFSRLAKNESTSRVYQ